jgi:UDP-N-acetylglucosamine 2-epimerase (non-hydrolysing)
MAPLIVALRDTSWASVRIVSTGQHPVLAEKMLSHFSLVPDVVCEVMEPNQSLSKLTIRLLGELDRCFQAEKPDVVIGQGDTTSVMAAALAAFYLRIPFAHVEAGLRTRDYHNPFPEEMNRVVVSNMAKWHFAPTEAARKNLVAEGKATGTIYVTGNTVVDALLYTAGLCPSPASPEIEKSRMVLFTVHRRENIGQPFSEICRAARYLADVRSDIYILFPVHPNPAIRNAAYEYLSGHPRIRLVPPLDYMDFVSAMKSAFFILTDSGGIQEEAPSLGKPVLVLRNETERPEGIDAGVTKLVGCDFDSIVNSSLQLLDDDVVYKSFSLRKSPYGDGRASARIVDILQEALTKP